MKTKKLKQVKRITAFLLCFGVAASFLTVPAWAEGGAYVSDDYLEIEEGKSRTISIGLDNATGSYTVYSEGSVSARGSGWLDNDAATITIYGAGEGSGTVAITFDTLATYDDEDLDGTTLYVNVDVTAPEEGYHGGDKGKDEEKKEEQKETETEQQTEAEKETQAPEKKEDAERTVTINNKKYVLLNDLSGVKIPVGFTEKEAKYNDEKIMILKYKDDLTFYVLRRVDDGKVVFREYDKTEKAFKSPRTIKQNKKTYYILDANEEIDPSSPYRLKDLTIRDFEVKGYASDEDALSDFVYLRALTNGEEGIYSYDQDEGTIQRSLVIEADDGGLQKELEEAKALAEKNAKTNQLLTIFLIVFGVILLGLAALLILFALRVRKTKTKKAKPTFRDLYPDADLTEEEPDDENDDDTF